VDALAKGQVAARVLPMDIEVFGMREVGLIMAAGAEYKRQLCPMMIKWSTFRRSHAQLESEKVSFSAIIWFTYRLHIVAVWFAWSHSSPALVRVK
jgi:hypothetical protein